MKTWKKTLAAICVVAALNYGVKNCEVKQSPAPMPKDFKSSTIERVFLPNLGEINLHSSKDGLVDTIRQYNINHSMLEATWASENNPDAKKNYGAYILSPEAQRYAKEMQEAGSKLAYELARIQYEADSVAKK